MLYDNTNSFVPIYERQGKVIVLNSAKMINWVPVSFMDEQISRTKEITNHKM